MNRFVNPKRTPCFLFHYWGNWSTPFQLAYYIIKRGLAVDQSFDTVQDRTCRKCGKVERRVLSRGTRDE